MKGSDRESPKEHPCKISLKSLEQIPRERFLKFFLIFKVFFFPFPGKPEFCKDPKVLKEFKKGC